MQIHRIIRFLEDVTENNNRKWFSEHKDEYLEIKNHFDQEIVKAVSVIAEFDSSIAHITPKDATYRFHRDTRFSSNKLPYKNHIGAYIAAKGKKSLHGGYYIHLESNHCLVSVGGYYLPTNILTSCRNEIMVNIEEWKKHVENAEFVKLFGKPAQNTWYDKRGFGLEHLKKCPVGFPNDYENIEYLRMKDYCCWHALPYKNFETDHWLNDIKNIFQVAKPMMDFINNIVDDYE